MERWKGGELLCLSVGGRWWRAVGCTAFGLMCPRAGVLEDTGCILAPAAINV